MEFGGYDIALLRRTRDVIKTDVAGKTETLIGALVTGKDEPFCRALAGRIQGLRDALTEMENIAKDMTGQPHGDGTK